MRYLSSYKKFFEDGDGGSVGSGDSSSGMGAVVSAQPGNVPGQTGTSGSGEVSFTFKKGKRKKGDPSQVSDMRDLEDVDNEIEKLDENQESMFKSFFYKIEKADVIEQCCLSLYDLDLGFTFDHLSKEKNNSNEKVLHFNIFSFKGIDLEVKTPNKYKELIMEIAYSNENDYEKMIENVTIGNVYDLDKFKDKTLPLKIRKALDECIYKLFKILKEHNIAETNIEYSKIDNRFSVNVSLYS